MQVDSGSPAQSRWAWLWRWGMLLLLLLLIITVFIVPAFVSYGMEWRLFTDVMLTLILVSGILAIAGHRTHGVVLAAVSAVVVVIRWAEWVIPTGMPQMLREILTLSALLILASAVAINVFARGNVFTDRIFGSIVLYLLIGLIWAVAYALLDASLPEAFAGGGSGSGDLGNWIYFSLVTLTTLGYGDITPVARIARSMAVFEALIGQLYPAIIIARLVSLQVTPK